MARSDRGKTLAEEAMAATARAHVRDHEDRLHPELRKPSTAAGLPEDVVGFLRDQITRLGSQQAQILLAKHSIGPVPEHGETSFGASLRAAGEIQALRAELKATREALRNLEETPPRTTVVNNFTATGLPEDVERFLRWQYNNLGSQKARELLNKYRAAPEPLVERSEVNEDWERKYREAEGRVASAAAALSSITNQLREAQRQVRINQKRLAETELYRAPQRVTVYIDGVAKSISAGDHIYTGVPDDIKKFVMDMASYGGVGESAQRNRAAALAVSCGWVAPRPYSGWQAGDVVREIRLERTWTRQNGDNWTSPTGVRRFADATVDRWVKSGNATVLIKGGEIQ